MDLTPTDDETPEPRFQIPATRLLASYRGLTPGTRIMFFPREGKPGRMVEIIELRPHPLHGAIVRFQYLRAAGKIGAVSERTYGRFHTDSRPLRRAMED
jgi:hypothetical protein